LNRSAAQRRLRPGQEVVNVDSGYVYYSIIIIVVAIVTTGVVVVRNPLVLECFLHVIKCSFLLVVRIVCLLTEGVTDILQSLD